MNSYICIHIWIHINYGFIWTFYVFGCTKVPHVGCLLGAWAGPSRGLVVQSTTWDAGDPGSNPALGTASSGHATVTTRSMSLTCQSPRRQLEHLTSQILAFAAVPRSSRLAQMDKRRMQLPLCQHCGGFDRAVTGSLPGHRHWVSGPGVFQVSSSLYK